MEKLLVILLLTGCASKLKDLTEISAAPKKMEQKIESVDESAAAAEVKAEPIKPSVSRKKIKVKNEMLKAPTPAVAPVVAPIPKSQQAFVTEWPFSVGEKATYIVRYGPIEGGRATIEVGPLKSLEGEPVLHYIIKGRSHKFFDFFYKVDDTIQSWVRLKDHLPLRQEILQNETGEWGRRIVIFNQKLRQQHFYSSTDRPNKPTKVIDERHGLFNFPQDMPGSYFFARFVKDPMKINFPVHDRFKHWNNELFFDGKEEVVTKAGTFMCNRYLFFPRVQGNLEPQGNATIWLSDDSRRIMTRFKVKIKIGSITGDMVEYVAGKPWTVPIPIFATPLNLDPSNVVSQDEIK